jgi:SanA protein
VWKKLIRMVIKTLLFLLILAAVVLILSRLTTAIVAHGRIFSPEDVPTRRVAIVFGAGLWGDGTPTPILRDRVQTAANLFFSAKVEKILMSGDNRFVEYNEPAAMREYALTLGVPDDAIVLDYAGRRTYDTCFRAKAIFGLNEVILVTQSFHLARALFTCNQLGLESDGVSADLQVYDRRSLFYWNMRELLATSSAFWDVFVRHPIPVLGDPEPIFP